MVLAGKSQLWQMWLGIYLTLVYWQKFSVTSGSGLIHVIYSGLSSLLSPKGSGGNEGQGHTKQVCLRVLQWQAQATALRKNPVGSHQTLRSVPSCGAGKLPQLQVL